MLTKNKNTEGRKKLNSETLASRTVQPLATDITGERLPESKYRTGMQKNKPGVTLC
ncbi:hypothetical protein [Xenorhabdus innexi]|uniref:Uncharacterized protein n=1 Tax=Xenorhabdus innexi TaxID=290109 RepID=A0A1N6N116_9GAMM|nr:hypothetical protein [Xenorhabdus innexi]PHM31316.1 hypothetical protein Xinn_02862 [Xenorhabdus innexi]SIP74767.1 conserved hypothetical protein [Xenorhabdus innexi]